MNFQEWRDDGDKLDTDMSYHVLRTWEAIDAILAGECPKG